jgi:3-hydroxyisobutyrate dehydrogenase
MKVAFLGTGLMGLPMAQRLLQANVPLIAYNRTPEKLKPLQLLGAEIAAKPYEAIRAADCVILMLTNTVAIYNVLLSDASLRYLKGRTVIQMGTITPSQSQEIQETVITAGGEYIEAPVLGSIPEAETGNLIVMVGGEPNQYSKNLRLLRYFSPEPLLIGPVGSAAALKLALNQLIASLTTAFGMSLAFVQRQGVEVEIFMKILRDSSLYAPTFDKKLQRMLDNDYENPNFPTKYLFKDTDLFLSEAESLGLNVSSVEGVRTLLKIAMNWGFANDDYSALFAAIKADE